MIKGDLTFSMEILCHRQLISQAYTHRFMGSFQFLQRLSNDVSTYHPLSTTHGTPCFSLGAILGEINTLLFVAIWLLSGSLLKWILLGARAPMTHQSSRKLDYNTPH